MMSENEDAESVGSLTPPDSGHARPPGRAWRDPRTWVGFVVLAPIAWVVAFLATMTENGLAMLVFLLLPLIAPWSATSNNRGRAVIAFVATAVPAWPVAALVWFAAMLASIPWYESTNTSDIEPDWLLVGLSSALVAAPFVAAWSARLAWRWLVPGLAIAGCVFVLTAELIQNSG